MADALVEPKKLLYPDTKKAAASALDNKGDKDSIKGVKGGSGKGNKVKG